MNKKVRSTLAKVGGPALIFSASTLWALDGLLRRSLYVLPPLIIIAYEHWLGFIFWWGLLWRKFSWPKISARAWLLAIIVAVFSSFLGTLLYTGALVKVGFIAFSVVILLQKLQPIFTMAMARLVLGEKLGKGYLVWASVAMLAGLVIAFPNLTVSWTDNREQVLAALMALGAAAAWGSSTVFSKLLIKEVGETLATGLRFGIAGLVALVVIIFAGGSLATAIGAITLSQLARFAAIALSTGMLALWLYYKGLSRTEAKVSTIIELWFPALAVGIDMLVYGQMLQPIQLLGMGVLLWAARRVVKE